MRYINKENTDSANEIIDDYLEIAKNDHWYETHGEELLYKQFGSFERKDEFYNILLQEQHGYCCYCQQSLSNIGKTLEHIIPQSKKSQSELDWYFNFGLKGLNDTNICLTSKYIAKRSKKGQYPHKIAYHNLVIACKDCNNNRENLDIYPLFLQPNIEQEIIYNKDTGEVSWINDPVLSDPASIDLPLLEKLSLNTSKLKIIRAIWGCSKAHPSSEYKFPNNIDNQVDRNTLIYGALGYAISTFDTSNLNTNLIEDIIAQFFDFSTDLMWSKLLRFDYFGTEGPTLTK